MDRDVMMSWQTLATIVMLVSGLAPDNRSGAGPARRAPRSRAACSTGRTSNGSNKAIMSNCSLRAGGWTISPTCRPCDCAAVMPLGRFRLMILPW